MSVKISLSGTITVTAAQKVLAICNPLIKTLGISFFRYVRIFNDGSKFILCTSADVMKFMYEEGHYIHTWYDNGKPASQFQPGCNFWTIDKLACNADENLLAAEIFKHFNLSDGLFYCYKHPEFVELFDFLSANHDIYFINKTLLFRFMYYFKEQARKLILQAEHEKIYSSYAESNENNKSRIHSDDADFIKNTPIINIDNKDYYPELFFNGMNTNGISFSERV